MEVSLIDLDNNYASKDRQICFERFSKSVFIRRQFDAIVNNSNAMTLSNATLGAFGDLTLAAGNTLGSLEEEFDDVYIVKFGFPLNKPLGAVVLNDNSL